MLVKAKQMTLDDLKDIGIAICICGDFLIEHGDDGECLICECQKFKQDVESDTYFINAG